MDVVLIHGMGRTPLSMRRLARRLRRGGHKPVLFGYAPTFETLQGATARLIKRIAARVDTTHYALVGHSLGSVLIRTALPQLGGRLPAACYFLAPPMVACRAARYFSRFGLYRVLTGEMGQLLAHDAFMQALPMPPVPTRIYAGTNGPRASWLPFGREANDGILSVAEATGRFAALSVEVPAVHAFIMNSHRVFEDMVGSLAAIERARRSNPTPEHAMAPRHPDRLPE